MKIEDLWYPEEKVINIAKFQASKNRRTLLFKSFRSHLPLVSFL